MSPCGPWILMAATGGGNRHLGFACLSPVLYLPQHFVPAFCGLYLNLTRTMQGKWYLSILRMKKGRHREIICLRSHSQQIKILFDYKSRKLCVRLMSLPVPSLGLTVLVLSWDFVSHEEGSRVVCIFQKYVFKAHSTVFWWYSLTSKPLPLWSVKI